MVVIIAYCFAYWTGQLLATRNKRKEKSPAPLLPSTHLHSFFSVPIRVAILNYIECVFLLWIAVQKGRISTTQSDAANSLQMGLADMRNPQSFYSSYITLLLRADTIARYQQSLGIPANITGLESASELAARLLVSIAEWAKNIPFFSEFTLPDQSILLRSCWSELFILNAAQHCSPFHMAQPLTISALTPPSSTDLLTVNGNGSMAFDSAENLRLFEEQVEKLKNLHIDSAEFCCLKAIILFNPGGKSFLIFSINNIKYCRLDEMT